MGIVPEDMKKRPDSPFIQGEDFERGIALEVIGFQTIVFKDPQYGADTKDYLFTTGKLKQGETFRYTFRTIPKEGANIEDFPEDKTYDSKSAVFFIAFSNLDPNTGDKIWIKRSGKGRQTKYVIEAYNGQDAF